MAVNAVGPNNNAAQVKAVQAQRAARQPRPADRNTQAVQNSRSQKPRQSAPPTDRDVGRRLDVRA